MNSAGEHIWAGIIGNALIIIALLSVIISIILYIFSFSYKEKKHEFVIAGNWFIIVQFCSLLAALFVLLHALFYGYHEYAYVWMHTSPGLPIVYKISALWAGKEGSMLFWVLCQSACTLIYMLCNKCKKDYEKVLLFILPVQAFLIFFITGYGLFGANPGGSPFELLRNLPENADNRIFQMPGYLSVISKGAGLNPLLRNFWMVIHPPVLLAGYAAAIIPWALSMTYLSGFNKNYPFCKSLKIWSWVALFILAAGIGLGGAWAYVALSFGGFWTWDPVENASLVPWLLLLAGCHLFYCNKLSKTSASLFILAFLMVMYAAFLTRSGVLGNFSVHSFSDKSIEWSLGYFILFMIFISLIIYVKNYISTRKINKSVNDGNSGNADVDTVKPENTSLRDVILKLFIAILILSSFHIFFNTSLPLFNYLFGSELILPPDTVGFYNKWQSVFLIFVLVLLIVHPFIYTDKIRSTKSKVVVFILFAVAVSLIILIFNYKNLMIYPHAVLLALCMFAIAALVYYSVLKGAKGMVFIISHLGFVIFITGILLAFGGNGQAIKLVNKEKGNELIYIEKGSEVKTEGGIFTYTGFNIYKDNVYYNIDFLSDNTGKLHKLSPELLHDEMYGNVFEPYIKKSIFNDLFVYVVNAGIDPLKPEYSKVDTSSVWLKTGDSVITNGWKINLQKLETDASGPEADVNNIIIEAVLSVKNKDKDTVIRAGYVVKGGKLYYEDAFINQPGLKVRFRSISQDSPGINLFITTDKKDFVMIKAKKFPFINLVWAGLLLIAAGITIKIIRLKIC